MTGSPIIDFSLDAMDATGTRKQHLLFAGVATAGTALIAWPVLAHSESLLLGAGGVILVWFWLWSLFHLGGARWPYQYVIAVLLVLLSFIAPGVAVLSMGATTGNTLISAAIVGLILSAVIAVVLSKS